MADLAIKGHSTRGDEVRDLLVMLGAKSQYTGTFKGFYYWIEDGQVTSSYVPPENSIIIFSLEEFEEKYPYKVGDNVTLHVGKLLETHKIIGMRWDSDKCRILYYLDNYDVIGVEDILYSIECKIEQSIKNNDNLTINSEEAKRNMIKIPEIPQSINLSQSNVNEIEVVLGDYEFILKDGKTYFIKKKPKYPTCYVECCDILKIDDNPIKACGEMGIPIFAFAKLIVARNSYWEIAGEELGLGKPWEPDWNENNKQVKFGLYAYENQIRLINLYVLKNSILVFPTEKMRNTFYENFKELIEQCKELL